MVFLFAVGFYSGVEVLSVALRAYHEVKQRGMVVEQLVEVGGTGV